MSKGWACVVRFGGIGDNLIASSPLRPLKRLGYNVEVVTSPHAHSVFLNNPHIDKLTIKSDGDIPGGDDWQKWMVSRSREYDVFAHLSHTGENRHALFQNQTAFYWPAAYRRKMCAGSYLETAHDICAVAHDFGPLFFPTDEEKDRAEQTKRDLGGGKCIAWVIAGSRPDKIYPFGAMVIPRLIKELGARVMMVGAGGLQFEMAKRTMDTVRVTNSVVDGLHLALSPDGSDPGGHQNWSTRRSLAQTLACDLVISPDTGIAWAAAMEPMPKIMLLSHASAENITKHWVNTKTLHADQNRVPCWPCHRLHNDMTTCAAGKENPNAAACMDDISVETIVNEARRALNPHKSTNVVWSEPVEFDPADGAE